MLCRGNAIKTRTRSNARIIRHITVIVEFACGWRRRASWTRSQRIGGGTRPARRIRHQSCVLGTELVAEREQRVLLYRSGIANHSLRLVSRAGAGQFAVAVSRQSKHPPIPLPSSKSRPHEQGWTSGGI